MRGCSAEPSSGSLHLVGFSCTLRFTPAKLPPASSTVCTGRSAGAVTVNRIAALSTCHAPRCSVLLEMPQ